MNTKEHECGDGVCVPFLFIRVYPGRARFSSGLGGLGASAVAFAPRPKTDTASRKTIVTVILFLTSPVGCVKDRYPCSCRNRADRARERSDG